MRELKALGTADADALAIEAKGLFNTSNLLLKAEAARVRREAAGVSDSVEVAQPLTAPAFNGQLVGKRLEVSPHPTPHPLHACACATAR